MTSPHANTRLEALCDGVFAIALTLLILDVKLPSTERITSTAEFWRALRHLAPSVFAFSPELLHYPGHMGESSCRAEARDAVIGFAAPAVVLYNGVLAMASIGWLLVGGAALRNRLTTDAAAAATMRASTNKAYPAFLLYALLAVTALWFPLASAAATTVTWLFWLVLSIRLKHT